MTIAQLLGVIAQIPKIYWDCPVHYTSEKYSDGTQIKESVELGVAALAHRVVNGKAESAMILSPEEKDENGNVICDCPKCEAKREGKDVSLGISFKRGKG